jgi:hypothetical protein
VHAFFDRVEALLPTYVSPLRAAAYGAGAAVVMLALLAPELRRRLARLRAGNDAPRRLLVHLGVVLASVLTVGLVSRGVGDLVFASEMIFANKRHFALQHWVGRYAQAARAPFRISLPA